jgi:hypothetical protein
VAHKIIAVSKENVNLRLVISFAENLQPEAGEGQA